MSEFAISAQNVSKYYKLYGSPKDRLKEALNPFGKSYHKRFYALKNIDLEIKKGELLGVVGKNGSGKSTLLKVIAGVLTPDEGGIHINGKISALLELGSGFNPGFTGLQNIYFYGMILGLSRADIDSMLDDILSFADIGEFIHQPLKTYSSGMKSRLGFSVATAIKPEILIIDEVLAVGDAQFKRKSSARMKSMMDSGCTVLLVSHSENTINQLCSKAVYIREGEIVAAGIPKNITKLYLKVSDSKNSISNELIQKEMQVLDSGNSSGTENKIQREDDSFFSYKIQKQSTPVVVDNMSIELFKMEILNTEKQKVNILNHGKKYSLIIQYKFTKAVDRVVFPVTFNTDKGQLIFGVRNPNDGDGFSIGENEVVETIMDFTCNFLRGMYFLTAGVVSYGSGEREILHTVSDAMSFKVLRGDSTKYWGLMSTGLCELQFKSHCE